MENLEKEFQRVTFLFNASSWINDKAMLLSLVRKMIGLIYRILEEKELKLVDFYQENIIEFEDISFIKTIRKIFESIDESNVILRGDEIVIFSDSFYPTKVTKEDVKRLYNLLKKIFENCEKLS